jgi:uncharacterized OB-fold protein
MPKQKVAAVEGWFTMDAEPHLLGSRCTSCRCVFFPLEADFCRNPSCAGTEFTEVALSRRGRLWSYTDSRYAPPPPYMASEPYEPYGVAAVELEDEKMIILGQLEPGVSLDSLEAGMEMELVIGTLYEDDENEYLVWKWRPAAEAAA